MARDKLDAEALAATMHWGDDVVVAALTRTGTPPPALPPDAVDELRRHSSGAIARLTVKGTLGQGGMGIVHLADQESLQRQVAVKTLDRKGAESAHNAGALLREARITGSLEHPNIVPVYDVDVDDNGNPRVILKRIDGVDWARLLEQPDELKERFGEDDPLKWHLRVLEQVMNAVRFAHSRGVLHLDIKPNNVMIGEFGEVYLLDWGIALRLDDDGLYRIPDSAESASGTPAYMAPEMIAGSVLDKRTDVYLLGATLYEIVCGEPPHRGSTPAQVITCILESRPPFPSQCPPGLQAICARAMAAKPVDRFDSVDDLAVALKDYVRHRESERLAQAATSRLQHLQQAFASDGDGQEIYNLYGECRFGFRAALETWPENQTALTGLTRAAESMIDFELARQHTHAAKTLLGDLREPDAALVTRVEKAAKAAEERQRALGALAHDLDSTVGRHTRRLTTFIFGGVSTLLPLVVVLAGAEQTLIASYTRLGVLTGSFLVMWLLLMAVFHRTMFSTAINRRFSVTALLAVLSMVVLIVGGWFAGAGPSSVPILFFPLWAVTGAMLAICVERRLWPLSIGYLAGYYFTIAYPSALYWALAGSNVVMMITMALYAFDPLCAASLNEVSRREVPR